jgi:hypothetical protein
MCFHGNIISTKMAYQEMAGGCVLIRMIVSNLEVFQSINGQSFVTRYLVCSLGSLNNKDRELPWKHTYKNKYENILLF